MKKYLALSLALTLNLIIDTVSAVPGEYWEITSTTEMPGMSGNMSPITMKTCAPKDRDSYFEVMNHDKECKTSNIKKSANKATFDITCNHDGEIMKGTAEYILHGDTVESSSHFTGKVQGHDMNMTQRTKGKRVGGSCDTETESKELARANDRKMASQPQMDIMIQNQKAGTEELCAKWEKDYSWVAVPDYFFGDQAMCAGKAAKLCEALRKDVSKDVKVYETLIYSDQQPGRQTSVTKECKVDIAAATKSICKTPMDNSNYEALSKYCPSEAKAFREVQRKKNCEGRVYTGMPATEGIKRCMSGDEGSTANSTEKPVQDGASTVLDSATKLIKGHFGF
jgi:hypothetical protein